MSDLRQTAFNIYDYIRASGYSTAMMSWKNPFDLRHSIATIDCDISIDVRPEDLDDILKLLHPLVPHVVPTPYGYDALQFTFFHGEDND